MKDSKINVRVEFESTPIRHIAVECPNCNNWFYGSDISNTELLFDDDLYSMNCTCPKCDHHFVGKADILKCGYPEVYEGVLEKKIEWV